KTTMSLFMRTALWILGCILLLSGTSPACFVVGDLNGDCRVDIGDLVLLTSQWMETSSCGSEAGLVLHWKFDETSGLYAADSSGSGKTGTVYGASWNPAGGKLGGTLQFDGIDDYVYAYVEGNPSTIFRGVTGTSPRSCTAWIKTDQPSGGIMAWGSELNSQLWLVWVNEKKLLCVDVGGGYVIGTTLLTDDLWHHIAVTSNGTSTDNIALYVDGKLETIGGVVSQSINTYSGLPMTLGKYYSTFKVFNGLIDDARVYNRVLSLQEVWNLAATGTTNNSCADLNTDRIVNLSDIAQLAQNWMLDAPLVVISEFLADNESKSPLGPGEILDGNGDSSDWIEIQNNSGVVMDINGWYLTDDAALKTKWQFPTGKPQLVLQPGAYLIVFASGKTQELNPANYPYVDTLGYLHTNFQLSKDGEYLGLFAADGVTPVHEYNYINLGNEYGYPEQETDISYGYYYDEERYFSVPTPGADNNKGSFEEVTEKPDVNFKGGCYINAFNLTMSCTTPGAFIRYTTNGTAPTLINGLDYTAPVAVSGTTRIIAKAFKPGFQPSDARIETYIFVNSTVSPSNTNLPIVVVDTLGAPIISDSANKPWTKCISVIVDVNAATGRAYITGPEHFNGLGQIRYRGESTYAQGHYAIEIQDENGMDKDVSLLGMPAESDWVLSYDVLDYTMMKKGISYKWFQDMGHYAPRQRYVELYLNTDGGAISTADYKGLFMLREKIKRDENRVDIARLDASHNLAPKVSGGYIVKNDKEDTGDVPLVGFETAPYGIIIDGTTTIVEPGGLLPPTSAQITWISNYMNQFHAALWQNTSSSYYVPGSVYTDYVEETSWIDHGFVEQIGNDADAFRFSYYINKDREGKLCSGPPWDYDRAFHNNGGSYDRAYNVWKAESKLPGKWHQGLQQYLEYKMQLADRWFEHREEVLNTALTMAYIDQTKALISESMSRSRTMKPYPKPFDEEINLFKTWITNRLNWLDGYIASTFAKTPPIFSPVGGYVNPGSSLNITKPSGATGDIYYTTNGQDPRLSGGAVNPNATVHIGGTVQTTETVVTMSSSVWNYLYNGSNQGTAWRAYSFNDSSWGSGPGQLGFGDGDEATNIGPKVNGRRTAYFRHKFNISKVSELTALKISLIHDDGAVVYINDQEVGRIYMPTGSISYNTPANVEGENTNTVFSGISSSVLLEGDNILAVEVHQNVSNSPDLSFDLNLEATRLTVLPPPPIVLNKSTCVKARIKNVANWSAMNTEVYGVGPVLQSLRISELMYHPSDPTPAEITAVGNPNLTDEDFEFIELANIGGTAINLNLVHFTDGIDFTFGDYTLAAGAYAVLVKNQAAFAARYGSGLPIAGQYIGALDNDGEEIVLRDALGAEIHDFDYKDGWYDLTP
ncbi:MAG: hypothetical protein FJ263_11365, partial [Planctomycetes bacterium]|nr:hypothetical protein [Planctomycetota bacterium]